jgi:predicted MPP superfamily phosphohydrolase
MKAKWILFFIFIIFGGISIYNHTNTLVITHHKVELGQKGLKLKIAHVSDLHTKGLDNLEKQLALAISNEKPDIIVITGDLATPLGSSEGYEAVLKTLKAPKGTYFVQGNWEYWEPIQELKTLFRNNNITDLTNSYFQLDNNLWFVGFDDSEEGTPKLDILESIPKSAIKIGLFHSPVFFDKVAGKTQLNLAGHSHGGQIYIPMISSFWIPEGTGKYTQGWFEKNQSKLYVNRGIGTSIVPLRFNSHPELAIIDIDY